MAYLRSKSSAKRIKASVGSKTRSAGRTLCKHTAPTLLPVDCLAAARKGSSGAKKNIKERARCRMAGLE